MEDNGMISVVIPTYNRAKLVTRSVRSVLNQTYKNIEVIVIDDNSSDNTEERIKKINDKRLRYYKLRKNHGACYARNVGISKAKGEYIAFQDSDDIFRKNKLELQLNNLLKNDSDLDFCKICVYNGDEETVVPSDSQIIRIYDDKVLDELCHGNFISTQAILIKRKKALEYLFDSNMPRLQDFDFVLRVVPNSNVSYTDEILVDLYRQDDSLSSSYKKLKKAVIIMLGKNYKISVAQKAFLHKWLEDCIDAVIYNENFDYNILNEKYNLLNAEYEKLKNDYNVFINSKRYKVVNKICDIIKKFKLK